MKRLPLLEDATDAVLDCREMGHAWRHVDDIVTRGARTIVEYTSIDECMRCKAGRRRVIEVPSFRIVRSTITYPDNYLAPKGARFPRAAARAERFDRILSR